MRVCTRIAPRPSSPEVPVRRSRSHQPLWYLSCHADGSCPWLGGKHVAFLVNRVGRPRGRGCPTYGPGIVFVTERRGLPLGPLRRGGSVPRRHGAAEGKHDPGHGRSPTGQAGKDISSDGNAARAAAAICAVTFSARDRSLGPAMASNPVEPVASPNATSEQRLEKRL